VYWVEVDGFPMPNLVGGHPALDLCNTWAGWGEPWDPKREWIPDYDRLAVWTGHAGLLDVGTVAALRRRAMRRREQADRVVETAHQLRAGLYGVLTESASDGFEIVARLAQRAMVSTYLVEDPSGVAERVLPASTGLELPLLAAARAAEDLLSSEGRATVGRCPGDDCGWLFLDPRGRRKWCSMATCGNRAKARAHFARQRKTR
jgi:predicted RNA-binding Zn ribbon-like protein